MQAWFANAIIKFLQHNKLTVDKKKATYIANKAKQCFLEDGILWHRLVRHEAPTRTVLVIPATLEDKLIHQMHGALLAGHEGITKTKEHLLQSYFCPNMDKDISRHIQACQKCQARRKASAKFVNTSAAMHCVKSKGAYGYVWAPQNQ